MEMKNGVFVKAAVAAIIIFAIALLFGYYVESQSYAYTEKQIAELNEGMESALLFSLFVQTHNQSESMCVVLKDQLDDAAQNTYNIYGALEESKSTSIFNQYDILRKKYFLANMRFYLMLRSYVQECDDNLEPILFFYSTYNSCPECVAQGKVLDEVRAECSNVRVYAFPADTEDISMIKSFKAYYGIVGVPTIVINDEKHEGLANKAEIKELVGC
jgi:glutaredoxin